MSDKTKKILLLNYHSETTEQAINLFEQFEVITAESLEDAAEKGKDDFDLVITGYVVPAVSGDSSFSYLKDIDTAIKNLEAEIRKNKTDEIIEREFREKQEQILQRLNDAIEVSERQKAETEANIKNMEKMRDEALQFKEQAEQELEIARKEIKVVLQEKQEAEKIAEAALLEKEDVDKNNAAALAEKTAIINKLTGDISRLNGQLEAAEENIRLMQIEHKKTQTKLAKLQETWENFQDNKY
jgi:hypothetical protein